MSEYEILKGMTRKLQYNGKYDALKRAVDKMEHGDCIELKGEHEVSAAYQHVRRDPRGKASNEGFRVSSYRTDGKIYLFKYRIGMEENVNDTNA